MNQYKNNIIKELEEISPLLATIPRTPSFFVPSGYFASLTDDIILKINKNEALADIPQGYFDNLAGEILMKIRAEEESSSLLATINKKNPHYVPAGYFDSLTENMLKKTGKAETRVVAISVFSGFFRYAAAAVITGILGVALFSRLNNKTESNDFTPVLAQAERIISTGSFESELNNLSDKEIIDYLESSGHDVEAAIMASAAESHELPDAIDYILQENTLDRFMDKFDIAGEF